MDFAIFDAVAIIVVTVFILRGAFKGFVDEFSGKAGILFGLFIGASFFHPIKSVHFIVSLTDRYGIWIDAIIFAALSVIGYILIRLFLGVMRDLLEVLHLNLLDNVLGAILGGLEGSIIMGVIVYLVSIQTIIDKYLIIGNSQAADLLLPIAFGLAKFDWSIYLKKPPG